MSPVRSILILLGIINVLAAITSPAVAIAASVANRPAILTALGDTDSNDMTTEELAVIRVADDPLAFLSGIVFYFLGAQGIALFALGVFGLRNHSSSADSASHPPPERARPCEVE